MAASARPLAAIYCRISDDKEGQALGVERQEKDCRKLAARLKLTVADEGVFVDNDLGASTASRKPRPAFDEMVAAVQAGKFAYVLAYSNSRLTRRPREVETLIELHQRTGVRYSTVVSGEDDLSTADGRMVARLKGNIDAGEAERVAERVARMHLHYAESGKPVGGSRPFGWLPDRRTLDPSEAPHAKRAVAAFVAGQGLNSIVRELREAGVTSTKGNAWTPDALRKYLANPRLCGWRMLKGEIVRDAKGQPVVGEWEPICSPAEWLAINERFKGRTAPVQARHKHLLSGIARCGKCMHPMRVMRGSKYTRKDGSVYYAETYICPPKIDGGCAGIGRNMAALDAFVVEAIFDRLTAKKGSKPKREDGSGGDSLAVLQRQRDELTEEWRAQRITSETYFAAVRGLEDDIRKQRQSLDTARARKAAADAQPADIRAEWHLHDVTWRRSVIKDLLNAVIVHPVPKGTKKWVSGSVTLEWREGV